jgi:hypothetical protein
LPIDNSIYPGFGAGAPASTTGPQPLHDADPIAYQEGSPLWWVTRFENELVGRDPLVQLYEDYYEGRQRLGFMTSTFRKTFGQMLAAVNDNWMPLVVRASVERLGIQGIQLEGDPEGTDKAWGIWQRNEMEEDAPLAFTEASKHGEAYSLTWWAERPGVFGRFFSRRSGVEARITVEHPAQMVVARAPGERRRIAAALKRWCEDDGTLMCTLFLPDRIYRFWRKDGQREKWQPYQRPGVPAEERNPLGVVPVEPLVNDPHMLPCYPPTALLSAPHFVPRVALGLGRSDLADVISTQDQINLLLCHFLVNSEFRSFMQRWATGLEVPEDDDGKPVEPYTAAIDRLWVNEDGGGKFGTFEQDDPRPILEGIDGRVMSIASRTRTPGHYLPRPTGNFPSGESLKAAETGLVQKVNDKKTPGGGWARRTTSLAFAVEGNDRRARAPKVISWKPVESRSESEFVDSLVKKLAIGVPHEQLWVDYGYGPGEISEFKRMLKEAKDLGLLPAAPVGGVASPRAAPPTPDEPPAPPPAD